MRGHLECSTFCVLKVREVGLKPHFLPFQALIAVTWAPLWADYFRRIAAN